MGLYGQFEPISLEANSFIAVLFEFFMFMVQIVLLSAPRQLLPLLPLPPLLLLLRSAPRLPSAAPRGVQPLASSSQPIQPFQTSPRLVLSIGHVPAPLVAATFIHTPTAVADLLIAIMSESHTRVGTVSMLVAHFERAKMILDYELLLQATGTLV